MTRAVLIMLAALLAVAVASPAAAGETRPTLTDLEDELVCPSCDTTLELSNSAAAEQMRAFIRERIAAGDSKREIKAKLVGMLGPGVLAEPPKEGFDLLAWLLPLAGAAVGVGGVALAARRWRAAGAEASDGIASADRRGALDSELDRRVDEELERFE